MWQMQYDIRTSWIVDGYGQGSRGLGYKPVGTGSNPRHVSHFLVWLLWLKALRGMCWRLIGCWIARNGSSLPGSKETEISLDKGVRQLHLPLRKPRHVNPSDVNNIINQFWHIEPPTITMPGIKVEGRFQGEYPRWMHQILRQFHAFKLVLETNGEFER